MISEDFRRGMECPNTQPLAHYLRSSHDGNNDFIAPCYLGHRA